MMKVCNDMIDDASWSAATASLESAAEIVVTCHVGPDGDALGSMLGFAHAAISAGKRIWAAFGPPTNLPPNYRFLPLHLLVEPDRVPERPELVISFDAGSLDRLGSLAGQAAHAKELVVVDHHISNSGFGHHNLIDPTAAASAQIAYELLGRLGWTIDEVVATCLLTGLVTDTGRFQYSNTAPAVLEVAARLIEAGARPEVVGQHMYEEAPFGYLGVEAAVLGRAVLEPERKWVWSVLRNEDLKASGIGLEDADMLIDDLRIAREAEVATLVKEHHDGVVKVSMRSRGQVNVGAIATALGGGGHHNAAGFTFIGGAEAAIAAVRERLG